MRAARGAASSRRGWPAGLLFALGLASSCAGRAPPAGDVTACAPAPDATNADAHTDADGTDTRAEVLDEASCARTYRLTSGAPLGDGVVSPRLVSERAGEPVVRSGSATFDGLYAMAREEAREASVTALHPPDFDDPLACGGCFESGRAWSYVWTRDTSYAVDLALAALDPARARRSLELKVSAPRAGGAAEIIEDTGTGGGYPVSSDRVVWLLGARKVLAYLPDAERAAFLPRAYAAALQTHLRDRQIEYDPTDGLYRGEKSFLDWVEQSYPPWMAAEPGTVGTSKALSTNVLHHLALRATSELAAELGERDAAGRLSGWADDLKAAIARRFAATEEGLLPSFVPAFPDSQPERRYDLLGNALAILADVVTPEEAARILERYPHSPHGAPVIWPEEKDAAIYHNRAIWPFVTAYWLRAARKGGNAEVVAHDALSLVRLAARSLSNMENAELETGALHVDDGPRSGPAIDSSRQLWSVAGYLAMVHDVLFGVEVDAGRVRVAPFLPRALRRSLFPGATTIAIHGLPVRDKRISVLIHLPSAPAGGDGGGAFGIAAVRWNGRPVGADAFVALADLPAASLVEVDLDDAPSPARALRMLDPGGRDLYGPRTPSVAVAADGAPGRLTLGTGGEAAADVTFDVYRDGARIATALPGGTSSWLDATAGADETHCYVVEATSCGATSPLASHRSAAACRWGEGEARTQRLDATSMTSTGGKLYFDGGRAHYGDWGEPGDRLVAADAAPVRSGDFVLRVVYANGTSEGGGITCGVKRVTITDTTLGAVAASAILAFPTGGGWGAWHDSTPATVHLEAAHRYRFELGDDPSTLNMSAFAHFATYRGAGGAAGPSNRVDVAELTLRAR